ncbi:hypothetical protein [Klenkia brasiliensis]|uniref:Uncharacterized protein n=1 Tax=Klenkia brasiliensis TaxID=333142 RepID=A0A1G7YHR0_9ACTN|nr:hypothetical protein [Klenkia brasiliensis]SDG95765.1 hypothetical protein SAMN05660324_3956 [Klenkia brasiliensis]
MSEPLPLAQVGPFDPPRPVWVRQPPRGRQREAMGVEGWLHSWQRVHEWGEWGWRAEVSDFDPTTTRLVPASSVLPREA